MPEESKPIDSNRETVDTTVTTEALLKLFQSRCEAALDPERHNTLERTVEDIHEVCENVLENE